ncbi:MAG TPA: DedA family protein [Chthoniobacterales bacterium]|nr:DedA family protein [Chthoniobacterales bacterium]
MHQLLELWFSWVLNWGYVGIIILMAMESSIFPVPSEIVMPPAAFLAAQGHLDFTGVVVAGTVGSYLGSAITYWVARLVGRPFLLRYGKFFFISPEKLARSEVWLQRYEAGGVFFARLLPVMRHLISIPAGVVRMNFWLFSIVTTVGSAIWCYILSVLGDRAFRKEPRLLESPERMVDYIKADSLLIVGIIVGLTVLYALVMRLSAKKIDKVAS